MNRDGLQTILFHIGGLILLIAGLGSGSALAHEVRDLLAQADEAYEAKNFEESTELYLQAVAHGRQDAQTYYSVAFTHARQGKVDEAFRYLGLALDYGFDQLEQLLSDPDLKSLRQDPRWDAIVARCDAKARVNAQLWQSPEIPYSENLSAKDKIFGLSKLWSEVKYNFVNFDLVPNLNWDVLYLEYLEKVSKTTSTLDYYKLLVEMAAKLGDGHTNVYFPRELRNELYARPLIRTRFVEGQVVVSEVLDESLESEGVQVGQIIQRIDGFPVDEYVQKNVVPYVSASTPQDFETRAYEYLLLAGSEKQAIDITLVGADGMPLQRTLERLRPTERNKRIPPRESFQFEVLEGNIGLVGLNSFGSDEAAQGFKEAFEEISGTDALIFDLRKNSGGNSGVGYEILSYLTDEAFQTSRWYTRSYRPAFRAWGNPQPVFGTEEGVYLFDHDQSYGKPVVVLANARTYSAAEDFLVAFQLMQRGKILGVPTGGSTGQPLSFALPGGGLARVCAKRDLYPDGREFVGVGVLPDEEIRPTIDDIRAGRDTILEAALKRLRK